MKACFIAVLVIVVMTASASAQLVNRNGLPPPKYITVGGTQSKAHSDRMVQTARQFYALWNTGKEAYARASVAPNFKDNTLPEGRPQGFNGLLFASKNFITAVPDLTCTIDDLLITNDKVTARLRFNGHNTGLFGDLPASGNVVSFFAIDILHIRNGKNC
jgi:predicted ester cyclase